MVYINEQDYLERKLAKKQGNKPATRNWWFGSFNMIFMRITIPKRFRGKHIRFKVEVIEEKKEKINLMDWWNSKDV